MHVAFKTVPLAVLWFSYIQCFASTVYSYRSMIRRTESVMFLSCDKTNTKLVGAVRNGSHSFLFFHSQFWILWLLWPLSQRLLQCPSNFIFSLRSVQVWSFGCLPSLVTGIEIKSIYLWEIRMNIKYQEFLREINNEIHSHQKRGSRTHFIRLRCDVELNTWTWS